MCRFALYMGPDILVSSLVTEPAHSIIHQSYHSRLREEPLNGDGFGIAWFAPEIARFPASYKSISPAWSNVNLRNLAAVTRSGCILAHVRAATPGLAVHQLNCHPFTWKSFAFMHNGTIAGFKTLRRKLQEGLSDEAFNLIEGSTDSEHLFALFVDEYRKHTSIETPKLRIATALVRVIDQLEKLRDTFGIEEPSSLNLAVTDGTNAVIARFISHTPEMANSLFVSTGKEYRCLDGICHMVEPRNGGRAVIVASEPLSQDEAWREVKVNHVGVIGPNLRYEERKLSSFLAPHS